MNKGLVTRRNVLLGALAGCLCLLVSNYFIVWPGAVQRAASYLVYPIFVMQRTCVEPIKRWFEHRKSLQEYAATIAHLEEEKYELASAVVRLQAMLGYAADTKELIDFRGRYTCSDAVVAQVLVKHISDQAHFFILDAGTRKGIQKNMVAVYKDHLIGKVVEVYPHYCKLMLITDRLCKVSAYCAQTKASGIYGGINNEHVGSLLQVSHLATIEDGDMILSTGDGLVFPRGFALGRIVNSKRNELFYDIQIQPLVELRSIDCCYILQKGNETITYVHDAIPVVDPKTQELVTKTIKKKVVDQKPSCVVAEQVDDVHMQAVVAPSVIGPVQVPTVQPVAPVVLNHVEMPAQAAQAEVPKFTSNDTLDATSVESERGSMASDLSARID